MTDPEHQQPQKKKGLQGPTKAETALLPPFPGISLENIHLPQTQGECQKAIEDILAAGICGFDTEARPTFNKGPNATSSSFIMVNVKKHVLKSLKVNRSSK